MKKTIFFLPALIILCMVSFTPTTMKAPKPVDTEAQMPTPSEPLSDIDLKEFEEGLKKMTLDAFEETHGRKPENDEELKDFELKLQKDGEEMIEKIIEDGKKKGLTEEEALNEFFYNFAKAFEDLDLSDLEEIEEEIPLEEPEKKPTPIPAPLLPPSHEVLSLQEIITQIIDTLHSFRLKSAAHKQMRDNLMIYKYRIDDLIYLLNVINEPIFIQKYLSDPAFAPLVDKLKRFNQQLVEFEDRFFTQEPALEQDNAYEILGIQTITASPEEIIEAYQQKRRELNPSLIRKSLMRQGVDEADIAVALKEAAESMEDINQAYNQLRSQEESKYLFESILSLIDQATDVNNIQGEIKKLLEKYKQDALKEFNEREKIEKEAREAHERSLHTRPFLYPLAEKKFDWPKPSIDRGAYGVPGFPSDRTQPPFEKEPKEKAINGKKPSKPTPGKGKKDDKKKKDDAAKKKEDEEKKKKEAAAKPGEKKPSDDKKLDKEVIEQLGVVKDLYKQFEKLIIDNFNDLQNFVTPYLTQPLNDTDIEKAKKLQGVIIEMTSKLNSITKKVKDAFKDNEGKRKSFKAEVKKLVDNFNKKLEGTIDDKDLEKLKKDIKNVPDIKMGFKKIKYIFEVKPEITIEGKSINNAKKYVFFGEGDSTKLPTQVKSLNKAPSVSIMEEPKEKDILEGEPIKKPEIKETKEKPSNFIDLLQKSYKNLEELFKK